MCAWLYQSTSVPWGWSQKTGQCARTETSRMPIRRQGIVFFFNSNIELTAKSVDADDINMLMWKVCLPKNEPFTCFTKNNDKNLKNEDGFFFLEILMHLFVFLILSYNTHSRTHTNTETWSVCPIWVECHLLVGREHVISCPIHGCDVCEVRWGYEPGPISLLALDATD